MGLTNLNCVTMNCGASSVSDRGIEALTRIPSLNRLGLESSSLTDVGMELIATRMSPRVINAANCPNVSARGLIKLAQAETLESFSFSSQNLTQDEAVQILKSIRHATRCDIIDPRRKLQQAPLYGAARSRNVRLYIREKGALQYHQEFQQRRSRKSPP